MKTMEKKGFTLIELLIVIAIIGILAVAFLPSLLDAPAKGRDTQRIASMQKINNALTNEFLAGNSYPAASGCITDAGDWTALKPTLGGSIPLDPQGTDNDVKTGAEAVCDGSYAYYVDPDGLGTYTYGLYAHLEGDTGNVACTDGVIAVGVLATLTTGEDCYAILVQ